MYTVIRISEVFYIIPDSSVESIDDVLYSHRTIEECENYVDMHTAGYFR